MVSRKKLVEEIKEAINRLQEKGLVEISGVDENGEFSYSLTDKKVNLKAVSPKKTRKRKA